MPQSPLAQHTLQVEASSDTLDDVEAWPVPKTADDGDDDFISAAGKRPLPATPIGKLVCDVCSEPEASADALVTCTKCASMGQSHMLSGPI